MLLLLSSLCRFNGESQRFLEHQFRAMNCIQTTVSLHLWKLLCVFALIFALVSITCSSTEHSLPPLEFFIGGWLLLSMHTHGTAPFKNMRKSYLWPLDPRVSRISHHRQNQWSSLILCNHKVQSALHLATPRRISNQIPQTRILPFKKQHTQTSCESEASRSPPDLGVNLILTDRPIHGLFPLHCPALVLVFVGTITPAHTKKPLRFETPIKKRSDRRFSPSVFFHLLLFVISFISFLENKIVIGNKLIYHQFTCFGNFTTFNKHFTSTSRLLVFFLITFQLSTMYRPTNNNSNGRSRATQEHKQRSQGGRGPLNPPNYQGNSGGKGASGRGQRHSSGQQSSHNPAAVTHRPKTFKGLEIEPPTHGIFACRPPEPPQEDAPPPGDIRVIRLSKHLIMQAIGRLDVPEHEKANAILFQNITKESDLPGAALSSMLQKVNKLIQLNYDIDPVELQDRNSPLCRVFGMFQATNGQVIGDVTSTADSLSVIVNLRNPQAIGERSSERGAIPPIQRVTMQIAVNETTQKYQQVYATFDVVAVCKHRSHNESMAAHMSHQVHAGKWNHIANVSLFHEDLAPALPMLSQHLKMMMCQSLTDTQQACLAPRMMITLMKHHYVGTTSVRLDELKSPGLAVYMFLDPSVPAHHDIKERVLVELLAGVKNLSAEAMLGGIRLLITKTPTGEASNHVQAKYIIPSVTKPKQYWICVSNLPAWFTSHCIYIILTWSFGLTGVVNVFKTLDSFNEPAVPNEQQATPSTIISVQDEQVWRTIWQHRHVIQRGMHHLIAALYRTQEGEDEVTEEDSQQYARDSYIIDISSQNLNAAGRLPHINVNDMAAQVTTTIQYRLTTPQTIENLMESEAYPLLIDPLDAGAAELRGGANTAVDKSSSEMEESIALDILLARLQTTGNLLPATHAILKVLSEGHRPRIQENAKAIVRVWAASFLGPEEHADIRSDFQQVDGMLEDGEMDEDEDM